MEDTLRDGALNEFKKLIKGLNPCFNGRYSQRLWKRRMLSKV